MPGLFGRACQGRDAFQDLLGGREFGRILLDETLDKVGTCVTDAEQGDDLLLGDYPEQHAPVRHKRLRVEPGVGLSGFPAYRLRIGLNSQ